MNSTAINGHVLEAGTSARGLCRLLITTTPLQILRHTAPIAAQDCVVMTRAAHDEIYAVLNSMRVRMRFCRNGPPGDSVLIERIAAVLAGLEAADACPPRHAPPDAEPIIP